MFAHRLVLSRHKIHPFTREEKPDADYQTGECREIVIEMDDIDAWTKATGNLRGFHRSAERFQDILAGSTRRMQEWYQIRIRYLHVKGTRLKGRSIFAVASQRK